MLQKDSADKIQIIVIDDDLSWIRLLTININSNEEDMLIIGAATTVKKGIGLVKTLEPDIVLLGINLSENQHSGIDVAFEIKKVSKCKIIMLTNLYNEELIKQSFTAGAVNYLSKSDINRLPDTIRTIYKGTSVIETLARDYERLKTFEQKEKTLKVLSDAEKEVMNLYIMGYKRKEIASNLGKTEDTVKNQVTSSLKKLKIGSKKELLERLRPF